MKKKNVLVIVAHPDDETLWMGGTLIRNKKKWETKIVCLTRKSDPDRYPKFKKVMSTLGVKGYIYNLDDKNLETPLNQDLILKILKKFSDKYDLIFTHNVNGEYGHTRHKDTHEAVILALKKKIFSAKEVFFFSYQKINNEYQGYAIYNSNADKLIKLNRDELSMKRDLAINVYGYDRGGIGFEELSAGPIESFDKLK